MRDTNKISHAKFTIKKLYNNGGKMYKMYNRNVQMYHRFDLASLANIDDQWISLEKSR